MPRPPGERFRLASAGRECFRVRTPKLGAAFNGAGDAIAALFLVHYLATRSAREGTRSLNSHSSDRATRSASAIALVKVKCG